MHIYRNAHIQTCIAHRQKRRMDKRQTFTQIHTELGLHQSAYFLVQPCRRCRCSYKSYFSVFRTHYKITRINRNKPGQLTLTTHAPRPTAQHNPTPLAESTSILTLLANKRTLSCKKSPTHLKRLDTQTTTKTRG